jgi:hypothetical protein
VRSRTGTFRRHDESTNLTALYDCGNNTAASVCVNFKLFSESLHFRLPRSLSGVGAVRAINKRGIMGSSDRDQLEVLKRQIEDDYRLDMSAAERLQRRFGASGQGVDTLKRQIEDDYRLDMSAVDRLQRRFTPSSLGVPAVKEAPVVERNVTVMPAIESQPEAQPDELTNTLRGMFSAHRR